MKYKMEGVMRSRKGETKPSNEEFEKDGEDADQQARKTFQEAKLLAQKSDCHWVFSPHRLLRIDQPEKTTSLDS